MSEAPYVSFDDVLAESLTDPEFKREWDRTRLARDVSTWVVKYRTINSLTQTALARQLGLQQPAVARLEDGEHTPSIETMANLSQKLGLTVRIDITPRGVTCSVD